jgi:hypothetical protein
MVITIREKRQSVTISATPIPESQDSLNTVDSVISDSASGWSAEARSFQSSATSGTSKNITTLVTRGFSPGRTIQQQPKKQASFREEAVAVSIREPIQEEQTFDDDVFAADEEDIDESAIDDDDDSSNWESSSEDGNNVGVDEDTMFQRLDSRPRLALRRSLLTAALHQNDSTNGLMNQAAQASRSTPALQRSRTSSPNGPSLAASPDSDEAPLTMKRPPLKAIAEVPRTGPQPITMTTTNNLPHPIPHSPRTTRRNMLATELTVSLRQHLLWERQQKSQTANAVLKRRHTAHDVANQYFNQGLGEYHSKGW